MSTKNKSKNIDVLSMNIFLGGVSLVAKALFAKHLAVMLKSGLPLGEALEITRLSARGKLKKVISGVLKSVESGHSLHDAFARYPKIFSNLFINVTKAGEISGTLVESMENIASELEKEKKLKSKIIGATIYPIIVLVAIFGLGMVISFVILPKITPLFEGLHIELPFTTRVLISFSHFVQDYGVAFFLSVVVIISTFAWTVRQSFSHPVTHWMLLNTPFIKGVSRSANLTRFSRTLGTLLKSGVHIDEALTITAGTTSNYYYRTAMEEVNKNIRSGAKLSDNLATHNTLFPITVVKMIQVGEVSGNLEETLFYLADFYEAEVDSATKAFAVAVEPALLLFIGLMVGFLALSIITPIYDITGNINR